MNHTNNTTDSPLKFVREDLKNLEVYSPVKPLEELAEEIGVPIDELVKLDANENLYGPIPEVIKEIERTNLHIYPDPCQTKIRKAIADYLKVDERMVIAGAGADDLIDIVMRILPQRHIIISTPTFGMYSYLAKISKIPIIDVPRTPAPYFELDVPTILKTITENNAVAVFLTSPNNPTGNLISHEIISTLCKQELIVVVDEAYMEFSHYSAIPLLSKYPNLIILRTFSKWSGLAGLRVGFAIAHTDLVNVMLSIKQPYSVSAIADVAARACLQYSTEVLKLVEKIKEERNALFPKLQELKWLEPIPSESNFILCKVNGHSAKDITNGLRKLGILVRYFSTNVLQNYIRISVGRPIDSIRLLKGLSLVSSSTLCTTLNRTTLNAIIFDMDGVLADVSKSYRQAIIQTAASFGVQLSGQDIIEMKKKGNANNDWELTRRLLEIKGVIKSLHDVTEKFEELYQGTTTTPGFYQKETLIPFKSLLTYLASRVPLAIVTGRPKHDANQFLNQYGITHLFKKIICMEDAPLKPNPAPVRLAKEALQVTGTCIMIGDTPDDIKAAKGANVIGLGILAPQEIGSASMKQALIDAGADYVLQDLQELRLLLM